MSGTVWATEPDAELPIRIGKEGLSARPPTTVFGVFAKCVENNGERPALKFKDLSQGLPVEKAPWKTLTWAQYYIECLRFGKSLLSMGFEPHRCTNIIGFNSPEWFIANLGTIAAGGIVVGIYATNFPEACQYITNHSEAEVLIVENEKQLNKFITATANLKSVKAIVVYKGDVPAGTDCSIPVYTWDQFMKLGENIPDSKIQERIDAQRPGMACSLIYTSGTTGPPKAVMISHDNLTWTAHALVEPLKFVTSDSHVTYLPLSHITGQLLDLHAPMVAGSTIYFAQPDAFKGSLVKTLKEVRPTLFIGVPRVWEKMYEKMQEVGRSITGVNKSISTWAKAKGLAHARMQEYGGGGGSPWGFGIANAFVLSKVKQQLGLDRTRVFYSSSAPISVEILEYFASLNIHIWEAFGQSESSGPHTQSTKDAWKIGSVGRPIQGTESKIVPETGELCYRGRHIFMGSILFTRDSDAGLP